MLHVFHVDCGKMMNFDTSLAMDSVENLKRHIQDQTNMVIEKQVLLMSGGIILNNADRLCSYIIGTESNPIFLFSMESVGYSEMSAYIPAYQAEKDIDVKLKSYSDLPASFATVTKRAQLAKTLCEHAKKQQKMCESIVFDQHLQHQGWSAVIANLDDLLGDFQKKLMIFEKHVNEYMEERQTYMGMLKHFDSDLATLRKIPVFAALREHYATLKTSTSDDDDAAAAGASTSEDAASVASSSAKEISLFEWMASTDEKNTVDQLYDHCSSCLEQFDGSSMRKLVEDARAVLEASDEPSMKEIKGLGDRLSGLDNLLREFNEYVKQQAELAQAFATNLSNMTNSKDPTVLPNLCMSHKKQLQMMSVNYTNICDIEQRCVKSKEELCKSIVYRLRWIMSIEGQISEMQQNMYIHNENIKRLRSHLRVLHQIHLAPSTYLCAVAEVARRRTFSQTFLMWASDLSCHLLSIHNEELQRRREFHSTFDGHFLSVLFRGMADTPPPYATQAPAAFDADLPRLGVEEVERLKRDLPDLAAHLEVPDSTAIERFFTVTALVKQEEAKKEEEEAKEEEEEQQLGEERPEEMEEVAAEGLEGPGGVGAVGEEVHEEGVGLLDTTGEDMGEEEEDDEDDDEEDYSDEEEEIEGEEPSVLDTTGEDAAAEDAEIEDGEDESDDSEESDSDMEDFETVARQRRRNSTAHDDDDDDEDDDEEEDYDDDDESHAASITREMRAHRKRTAHMKKLLVLLNSMTAESAENVIIRRKKLEADVKDAKEYCKKLCEIHKEEILMNQAKDQRLTRLAVELSETKRELADSLVRRETEFEDYRRALNRLESEHQKRIEPLKTELGESKRRLELALATVEAQNDEYRRVLRAHEAAAHRHIGEMRERLAREHKDEMEGLRARFKLMQQAQAQQPPAAAAAEAEARLNESKARERQLTMECVGQRRRLERLEEAEARCRELMAAVEGLERRNAQLEEERLTGSFDGGNSSQCSASCSSTVTVTPPKIHLNSCKKGDTVILAWDGEHKSYRVLQEDKYLYFLHSDYLEAMGLEVRDGKPNRLYAVGRVIDKDYCSAKKSENRYKVPKMTKFFRVKAEAITEKDATVVDGGAGGDEPSPKPATRLEDGRKMSCSRSSIASSCDVTLESCSTASEHPEAITEGEEVEQQQQQEENEEEEVEEGQEEESFTETGHFAEDSGIVEHLSAALDDR